MCRNCLVQRACGFDFLTSHNHKKPTGQTTDTGNWNETQKITDSDVSVILFYRIKNLLLIYNSSLEWIPVNAVKLCLRLKFGNYLQDYSLLIQIIYL